MPLILIFTHLVAFMLGGIAVCRFLIWWMDNNDNDDFNGVNRRF